MSSGIKVRGSAVFLNAGNRPAQEDHALVLEEKRIFVIADGFGGPVPGAKAAQAACESIKGFLFKEAGDLEATLPFELRSYFSLAGNVLFNALIHANGKVKKLNQAKGVHEKGGASVLAGFMDGNLLALANVGGCSAWLMRHGEIRELVCPRTYGRLCDPFADTSKQESEESKVPLMAMGISEDLQPEIFECRIEEGDWLLLQTDGISSQVRAYLAELQKMGSIPGVSAQELSQEALKTLESVQYWDNAAASLILF
jgi:protein phosphatase